MVQGVNKEYIFDRDDYINKYMKIIGDNKKDYKFTIIAYCVMNNHAHFLVYVEDMKDFEKFMHICNLQYAQFYNKENNRVGVLFRNRYQIEPIYNTKYLINCIKYIHNNPVKAGIALRCGDYQYSSYNEYMKNIGVTQTKIMKEIFGLNCDYNLLFKESFDKKFMDIHNEDKNVVDQYILEGINEFKKINNKKTYELLSNRKVLKDLIKFLYDQCGLKYIDIRNFLKITRGTMDSLKRN